MARFIPTPELWKLTDSEIAKLQPGQWVKCGGNLGRFVGKTRNTTWVTHRESKITPDRKLQPLTVPQDKFRKMRATFNPELRAKLHA